jgi:hypothetical protein
LELLKTLRKKDNLNSKEMVTDGVKIDPGSELYPCSITLNMVNIKTFGWSCLPGHYKLEWISLPISFRKRLLLSPKKSNTTNTRTKCRTSRRPLSSS